MVKITEMFEIYERAKNDMKFLITSDVRSKILISLNKGSKNLEISGMRYTSVHPQSYTG